MMGAPGMEKHGRTWAAYERHQRQVRRLLIVGHALCFGAGLLTGWAFL